MIEYERRALDRAMGELGGVLNALGRSCADLVAVSDSDDDYRRLRDIETELREMGQRWHDRLQEGR